MSSRPRRQCALKWMHPMISPGSHVYTVVQLINGTDVFCRIVQHKDHQEARSCSLRDRTRGLLVAVMLPDQCVILCDGGELLTLGCFDISFSTVGANSFHIRSDW